MRLEILALISIFLIIATGAAQNSSKYPECSEGEFNTQLYLENSQGELKELDSREADKISKVQIRGCWNDEKNSEYEGGPLRQMAVQVGYEGPIATSWAGTSYSSSFKNGRCINSFCGGKGSIVDLKVKFTGQGDRKSAGTFAIRLNQGKEESGAEEVQHISVILLSEDNAPGPFVVPYLTRTRNLGQICGGSYSSILRDTYNLDPGDFQCVTSGSHLTTSITDLETGSQKNKDGGQNGGSQDEGSGTDGGRTASTKFEDIQIALAGKWYRQCEGKDEEGSPVNVATHCIEDVVKPAFKEAKSEGSSGGESLDSDLSEADRIMNSFCTSLYNTKTGTAYSWNDDKNICQPASGD